MSLLTKSTVLNEQEPSSNILSINTVRNVQKLHYPRASSLYSACIRQLVIGTAKKLEKTEVVGFSRQLTFDIGSAVHSWIQNSDSYFGIQRRGVWECTACGKERIFGKPPTLPCKRCGADVAASRYKEVELLMHTPYCVTGHPDLFIEPIGAPGKIRVVELKTMNGDKFSKLLTPLVEHVWQIQTYMWACHKMAFELSVRIDDSCGYIVYVSKKETQGELPIKVFPVMKDERILTEIKTKLRLYGNSLKSRTLPPPDHDCERTKYTSWKSRNCPCLRLCMGNLDKQKNA